MKILTVISKRDKDFENYENAIEATDSSKDGWYLHGKLEDITGYDVAYALNLKDFGHYERTNSGLLSLDFCGITKVQVVNVEEPCIGYFWKDDRGLQRGLITLFSDKEYRIDARKKYKEKRNRI